MTKTLFSLLAIVLIFFSVMVLLVGNSGEISSEISKEISSAISLQNNKHAEEKHLESGTLLECANNGSFLMVLRNKKDPLTFYLFCQLSSGQFGIIALREVVQNNLKCLILKTAFIPGDGTRNYVLNEYLNNIATKWKGELLGFCPEN